MRNLEQKFKINKRAAAKRQLETALKLWFQHGDAVAIHTLGSAADEILHAIGRLRGRPSVLQERLRSEPKRIYDRMVAAQNFFKHGFRDPQGSIHLFPFHTELVLYDAVVTYSTLYRQTPLMLAYFLRFRAEHRAMFPDPSRAWGHLLEGIDLVQLAKIGRRQFLDGFLEAFASKNRRRFSGSSGRHTSK